MNRTTPALAALALTLIVPAARAEEACAALTGAVATDTTISAATAEPSGPFTMPDGHKIDNLPAFCRVEGTIKPTADSDIRFELWLPQHSAWNGRMLVVGNGGYVGEIRYDELEPALRRGYAVASADGGHHDASDYRKESLDWGEGHPERIADWAYRSIHVTAVAARSLIRAYEGRPASHAYYFGCSTGGGQGLMAAQRYPDDFDGIIAGAPGNNRTGLNMGFLWQATQNLADPAGTIPPAKLPAINRAALAACSKADGVDQGLIADPRQCRFDPAALRCTAGDADDNNCLTQPQIATLKRLYAGAPAYFGWPVGSEFGYLGGWGYAIQGPEPFRLSFFRQWVFKDPAWDWHGFDWTRDPPRVREAVGGLVDAVDPDLRPFRAHGGKLILYHGWADPIGNAYDTIHYYEAVERRVPDTASFARLFLFPGMGHCRGGIGPNSFDPIGALEDWVERGRAPEQLVALKSPTTDETGGLAIGAPGSGRTRPACAYPATAHYRGKGSLDEAASYICRRH